VEVLQGVRQMRFEGLLGRHEGGELSRRKRRTCWGVGGAVQALADRPRDEGPERFRDHRIGKLSSREPSTIKGPGPTGRLVSSVTTNRTAGHSRCLSIRSDVRKARWRALLLYAPSLLGWAVACGPLIGPKDMVSHGRVSNLP
jgi:hypothetical protein